MKGLIIYGNPMWGDNERAIYCEFINEASFELKNVYGSKEFTSCLKGEASECSKAICSPEDTYDFETGALIALMKMCGSDKVVRACNEAFSYETDIKVLRKDNNYLRYIKSCNESTIESLENTRDLLINKNNELIEENKKFKLDCEKLQHEYDLCKNSENALKITTQMQNKSIEKLTKAIDGYKNDLYNVSKRCRELEAKEAILNKQKETINKREEKISVYKEAYNTTLPVWQKEVFNQISKLTVDSLIEQGRAFTRKCVEEWLYKPHTKREEMWEKIVTNDKVVVKVKKEDINIFLKELETRNDVIRWITNLKPTEALTNPVLNRNAHSEEHCYFYLESNCRLWYDTSLQDNHKDFIEIDYLPPMRWDLFKKGRLVVKVDSDNYEDFYNKCETEIGRKPHYAFNKGPFTVYYKKGTFHTRPYDEKIPYKHKVINWEDVR